MSGLLALFLLLPVQESRPADAFPERMVVVMVWDGMRPDLISPRDTPQLHALAVRGATGAAHHAVIPTVTRVNAASLATGCWPATHGLCGNRIFAPELGKERTLDTGDHKQLREYAAALGGRLLTCPTLAGYLSERGMRTVVASSGSSGSAFFLDPEGKGATLHAEFVHPAGLPRILEGAKAPLPKAGDGPEQLSAAVVRGLCEALLPALAPHLCFVWLTDTDKAQHAYGPGSPQGLRAMRAADDRLGELVRSLDRRGLLARTVIAVVSDHGFVSHVAAPDLPHALQRAGQRQQALLADGAVRAGAAALAPIAAQLQKEAWVGAVFAAAAAEDQGPLGCLPGTFSARFLRWAHPRAGELLVLGHWLDEPGPHEVRGVAVGIGPGGHGNASPFEVHATLVVAGPGVRGGLHSSAPSANTDIAPTVCRLLGLPVPTWMEGRVLEELLEDGPHPWAVPVETQRIADQSGTFVLQATTMTARDGRKFRYVDLAGRVR